MAEINESRTLVVKDKIVTMKDVRALALLISAEESAADQSERNYREVSFSVDTLEGSSFQSADPAIFSDDSPIARRRVIKIELSYRERSKDKRISVGIMHGDRRYSNSVKVSGTDSKWVNGTISQIEQIICSMKPQNTVVSRCENPLGFVTAVSIGAITAWLIAKGMPIIPAHPSAEPDGVFLQLLRHVVSVPLGYFALKYFAYYIIGLFPGHALLSKLKSLWPSVELQIGPEHQQIEKQRRLWAVNVLVIGVIPLLLSLVYDLSKSMGAGG